MAKWPKLLQVWGVEKLFWSQQTWHPMPETYQRFPDQCCRVSMLKSHEQESQHVFPKFDNNNLPRQKSWVSCSCSGEEAWDQLKVLVPWNRIFLSETPEPNLACPPRWAPNYLWGGGCNNLANSYLWRRNYYYENNSKIPKFCFCNRN